MGKVNAIIKQGVDHKNKFQCHGNRSGGVGKFL